MNFDGGEKVKILILGSTGFIGKNLKQRLLNDDFIVDTAERSSGVNILKYEQIKNKIKTSRPDIIFNLACHVGGVNYVSTKAAEVYYDNLQMALNLYKAVSEVDAKIKIIQPLANCSYPADASIQKEINWLNGDVHPSVFSFGNSKRSIYHLSKCFDLQYGIKTINIIFPNTYGPGDSFDPNHTHALNGMIIRMLEAKSKGDKQFVVWGTGSPIREWAYIDDFVDVLIRCLEINEIEYPINMGQEKGYSIVDSAKLIKEACGYEGEIVFDTKYKDGAPIKIMSSTEFKKIFIDFIFFNHFEGILRTVEFYRSKI